jgi:hypothetical protein
VWGDEARKYLRRSTLVVLKPDQKVMLKLVSKRATSESSVVLRSGSPLI